jgi:hypothetical protein
MAAARVDDLEVHVVGAGSDRVERAVQVAQGRGGKIENAHRIQPFSVNADIHGQAAFS